MGSRDVSRSFAWGVCQACADLPDGSLTAGPVLPPDASGCAPRLVRLVAFSVKDEVTFHEKARAFVGFIRSAVPTMHMDNPPTRISLLRCVRMRYCTHKHL